MRSIFVLALDVAALGASPILHVDQALRRLAPSPPLLVPLPYELRRLGTGSRARASTMERASAVKREESLARAGTIQEEQQLALARSMSESGRVVRTASGTHHGPYPEAVLGPRGPNPTAEQMLGHSSHGAGSKAPAGAEAKPLHRKRRRRGDSETAADSPIRRRIGEPATPRWRPGTDKPNNRQRYTHMVAQSDSALSAEERAAKNQQIRETYEEALLAADNRSQIPLALLDEMNLKADLIARYNQASDVPFQLFQEYELIEEKLTAKFLKDESIPPIWDRFAQAIRLEPRNLPFGPKSIPFWKTFWAADEQMMIGDIELSRAVLAPPRRRRRGSAKTNLR